MDSKRVEIPGVDADVQLKPITDIQTLINMTTVSHALEHDVQTKEMQIVVEVPESKLDGDLESEIVSSVPAVKRARDTAPICPTCGEPYDSRGRIGWNHPIDLEDDLGRVCVGENGEHHSDGGLTWLYNHTKDQV